MQSGHGKIEREKYLDPARIAARKTKIGARNEVLVKFMTVLGALDAKENRSQEERGQKKHDDHPRRAEAGAEDSQRHCQAAANEHGSVDRAENDVETMAGSGEGRGVGQAIDCVSGE